MRLLRISLILIIVAGCKTKHFTPISGYKQLPELDKFEGEWLYSDSNYTFKLFLRKEKRHLNDKYMDFIVGSYCYTSKNEPNSCFDNDRDTTILSGSTIYDDSKRILSFLVIDKIKKKRGSGFLKLLPKSTNMAEWSLNNTEGIRVGKYDETFSIPTKLTLKKVR
ncbi:hypothetical protein I5M32_15895 [Pedobacter sp. SD-b]|uniref:DUF6705 domain-containing protein n=1 Tax=Pedobacter segetis TaxID=2793069 RepID=A0ABS1BNI0_9SPHI|nr:DUF6705 family protein [Pedobacter segetis]MBK0384448.1 hypothetical protein [Pedobacter segetis]